MKRERRFGKHDTDTAESPDPSNETDPAGVDGTAEPETP